MNLEELKKKLRKYRKEDIIITNHAEIIVTIIAINRDWQKIIQGK